MKNYFILHSVFSPEKIKQFLFEAMGNSEKNFLDGYPIYGKIPKHWICYSECHIKPHEKGSKLKIIVKFRKEIQILGKIFLIYNVITLFLCVGYYANKIPYSVLTFFLVCFFIIQILAVLLHVRRMYFLKRMKKVMEMFLYEKEQKFLSQSKQHEHADKIL